MKSGKAVYVEKPMASNYEDCCRINRIAEKHGTPCFVAYYRRYLPYFQKVRELVESGAVGNVVNVQIRFAVPPRDLDYNQKNLPWRVQPDIAGGGYFYDLAPHQIDLLEEMFGPILEAEGITANRGGLYQTEDSVSACFKFANGLPGSGSWCFVAHESAKEDCIDIVGDRGSLSFSVFTYQPIVLQNENGRRICHTQSSLRAVAPYQTHCGTSAEQSHLQVRLRECHFGKLGSRPHPWQTVVDLHPPFYD